MKEKKTLEQYSSDVRHLKEAALSLNMKKTRLENTINSFQNNNEAYVKIKQIVRQEIETIISNPRSLLKLALASIFESSRKHPGKLQTMYYNMPSALSAEQILSQLSINQNEQHPNQFGYGEYEKLLLDEAEQFYNRIVDAFASKCFNELPNDTESP